MKSFTATPMWSTSSSPLIPILRVRSASPDDSDWMFAVNSCSRRIRVRRATTISNSSSATMGSCSQPRVPSIALVFSVSRRLGRAVASSQGVPSMGLRKKAVGSPSAASNSLKTRCSPRSSADPIWATKGVRAASSETFFSTICSFSAGRLLRILPSASTIMIWPWISFSLSATSSLKKPRVRSMVDTP